MKEFLIEILPKEEIRTALAMLVTAGGLWLYRKIEISRMKKKGIINKK